MTLRLWLLSELRGVDMKDHAYIRAANDQQQLQIKNPNSMIIVGKLKRTLDLMGVPDDMPFVIETMQPQVCEIVEIRNDPHRGTGDVVRLTVK